MARLLAPIAIYLFCDASPCRRPPAADFRELQRHIEELTEERFRLQRCLEGASGLADRLAAENEALAAAANAQVRLVGPRRLWGFSGAALAACC
jgi:hypothetical protein